MRILVISAVIYLVALPFMIWSGRGFEPRPEPAGRKVELVFPMPDPQGWSISPYRFSAREEQEGMVLYEDLAPLAKDRYEVKPFGEPGWKYVRLRASDDTDPQHNGRHYYAVLP